MSVATHSFSVETTAPKQSHDITERVREVVRSAGLVSGLCHVMVLHSTAAIIVNENADPNIGVDVIDALDRVIPDHAGWLHDKIDDNAHAHIKASILGPSELLQIADGELQLGTWQGLMLMDFDGPRSERRVSVSILPANG